jgi:hypothetical protein
MHHANDGEFTLRSALMYSENYSYIFTRVIAPGSSDNANKPESRLKKTLGEDGYVQLISHPFN